MDVLRWPGSGARPPRCGVVTVGVFDGVHVGHAAILECVVSEARARSCRSAVVTFDRHPGALLNAAPQPAITSLDHRIRLFAALGLDACVVVEFTAAVAATAAEDFARSVFGDLLQARVVVLGEDARFGHGRRGDAALLKALGLAVRRVGPVLVGGRRVSSTAIRQAIRAGDFEDAHRLLGRPFSLYGIVVRGAQRGRALGYPTANLNVQNEAIPPEGVYAGWAMANGERMPCAISVGRCETFAPGPSLPVMVEVHLLDRSMDLYGRRLEVEFVCRLRPQQTFESATDLSAQIARDVAACRDVLAGPQDGSSGAEGSS
ncbi:MAG: riboflavin biosynthesis protein RibF [Candidatus Brocadiaceae bacterium]|nr:riboflavin biosynthesis protein RibF [Candidatus Brocadiaceae bacterium]